MGTACLGAFLMQPKEALIARPPVSLPVFSFSWLVIQVPSFFPTHLCTFPLSRGFDRSQPRTHACSEVISHRNLATGLGGKRDFQLVFAAVFAFCTMAGTLAQSQVKAARRTFSGSTCHSLRYHPVSTCRCASGITVRHGCAGTVAGLPVTHLTQG
jgi:hypothetical protein